MPCFSSDFFEFEDILPPDVMNPKKMFLMKRLANLKEETLKFSVLLNGLAPMQSKIPQANSEPPGLTSPISTLTNFKMNTHIAL